MFNSDRVDFAVEVVRRASRLVRQVQQELITPALTKKDRSPVTVGDFAAQALVSRLLQERFPGDPLVGEENAADLREEAGGQTLEQIVHFLGSQVPGTTANDVCDWIDHGKCHAEGRFWTLDPIDGTKGFLRREQYAVALALIEDGKVQLGVLGCPNLKVGGEPEIGGQGSIYVGVRGHGSWSAPLDGTDAELNRYVPVRVSERTSAVQARLLRSVEASHTDGDKIGELAQVLDVQADPVCMDSQAKYAVLAAGGGDVILRLLSPDRPDYREKIWDQAAGSIVVEEAGGRVSDLAGKPLDFSHGRTLAQNRGVLASNGRLHEALLEGLKKIGA